MHVELIRFCCFHIFVHIDLICVSYVLSHCFCHTYFSFLRYQFECRLHVMHVTTQGECSLYFQRIKNLWNVRSLTTGRRWWLHTSQTLGSFRRWYVWRHSPKSDHIRELFALLDFRPEIQILEMTKYSIPMHQHRPIPFFELSGVGLTRAELLSIY